jgi:hypothetical protein
MKSRRSFLAFVATAFICSMSTISPAHAGGGNGNIKKFIAEVGRRNDERKGKMKKEESGE